MSLCARRALLAVGGLLPWLAPGVSLVIAVVSRNLVGSIEMLYDKALLEGRIRSHTGQVFDQQFGPGLIYAWSALATLVTLVVVVLVERHLLRSQGRRRWPMSVAVALVVVFVVPMWFFAETIAGDQVIELLHSRWYLPFVACGARELRYGVDVRFCACSTLACPTVWRP